MVKAALASGNRRVEINIENFAPIAESISEAAERMERSKNTEAVEQTKATFKKMLETQAQYMALSAALRATEGSYAEPADDGETNFKAVLEESAKQFLTVHTQNPEEHPLYKKLLEDLKDADSEEEDEGSDEDVRVERSSRTLAPNVKCPVTQKALLDLEDPVQDQKGFVYERQAITNYITQRAGNVAAPVAGATHDVKLTDLRPAKKVIRAQRQARNQPTQTQRADEADIHDV